MKSYAIRLNTRGAVLATCVAALCAHAIEAPQPSDGAADAGDALGQEVAAADETAFYRHLQHVTQHRNLQGLQVPDSTIERLAQGNADLAVATLSEAASQGSEEANIALLRIQHWCGRMGSARLPEIETQIDKVSGALPQERIERAAAVLKAEAAFLPIAAEGCRRARFDYGAIEDRLREAADAGRPASATELAQFVRDAKSRDALLAAAAQKNYEPALYAVAKQRVVDVQRAERTEDVGSIRMLLKQAGRTIPKAKLDLANCVALGCDGHPADTASAKAFGIDAAREGEPTAFLSMVRMPWGRRISRTELLAWQYFGDRLNEEGCMGDAYIAHAISFAQSIEGLKRNLDEQGLQQASQQADKLWRDNASRAKAEQRCGR